MNNDIERNIIQEEQYTEANYPFTIKPKFSKLGSIIEISTQGPVLIFVPGDSTRDLLRFNKTTIFEKYNSSSNLVDILSFDKFFLECDIVQGLIFKVKDLEKFVILQWTLIRDRNRSKISQVVFNGIWI